MITNVGVLTEVFLTVTTFRRCVDKLIKLKEVTTTERNGFKRKHYLVATSYPSQSFRATRHMSLGFAMRTKLRGTAEEFCAGGTAEFAAALCHLQHPNGESANGYPCCAPNFADLECGFLVPFFGILPPFKKKIKSGPLLWLWAYKSPPPWRKNGLF